MINIGVPITVWKRPLITSFHFKWMNSFRENCSRIGVKIHPVYILSEDDPFLKNFKRRLEWSRHKHITTPRCKLTEKSQAGVDYLRDQIQPEWLMHLDSDELLSMDLMREWKKRILKPDGSSWFGSKLCYFVTIKGKGYEFLGYDDHPVKNGGTCLHREVLESVDWQLWPFPRNMGLNVNERLHLEQEEFLPTAIDTQDQYGVVELKGGKAIHGMDWFKERDMIRELDNQQMRELVQYHPMLKLLI